MRIEMDKIYCGDSLQVLQTLPENAVDCCVTSPPYYALRDYGADGRSDGKQRRRNMFPALRRFSMR